MLRCPSARRPDSAAPLNHPSPYLAAAHADVRGVASSIVTLADRQAATILSRENGDPMAKGARVVAHGVAQSEGLVQYALGRANADAARTARWNKDPTKVGEPSEDLADHLTVEDRTPSEAQVAPRRGDESVEDQFEPLLSRRLQRAARSKRS